MVLTCVKYLEKRDIKNVDKIRLYILFNRVPFKEELRYLEKVFVERNNFPRWLVKQMMKKVLDKQTNRNVPTATTNLPNEGNHCSIKT